MNDLTDMALDRGVEIMDWHKEMVKDVLREHTDEVRALCHDTSNLRFLPEVMTFDEDQFRRDVLSAWHRYAIDPRLLPLGGVDTWVEYARLWMSKGV
jgi:hypothetical protein